MSDDKSFGVKLKENWHILTLIGSILLALTTVYIQVRVAGIADDVLRNDASKLYIQQLIDAKVDNIDVPNNTNFAEIKGTVNGNTSAIRSNKERLDRTDDKIERIVDILLED